MALFSKRHYVWLASVARDQLSSVSGIHWDVQATQRSVEILADALRDENPEGFDKKQFLRNIYGPFTLSDGDEKCPTQSEPQN